MNLDKEYDDPKKTETLYVYELNTKESMKIDTSIAKPFKPVWIDYNTLEYDNPEGKGRVTKTFE